MGSETRFLWEFSGQCYMVFLSFSLVSWHGLNHAHSGMDGKATPAHDLNHAPCISFAGGQELFQQFLQNSLICCLL